MGNGGTDVKSCPRREVLKGQSGSGLSPAFREPKAGATWICFVLCSPRGQGQGQQIRQETKEGLATSRGQWEGAVGVGEEGEAAVRKAVGKGHPAEARRIPGPIGGRRSRLRGSALRRIKPALENWGRGGRVDVKAT